MRQQKSSEHYLVLGYLHSEYSFKFGQLENAKEVRDHLKQRYTISDLSYQYKLLKDLSNLKR